MSAGGAIAALASALLLAFTAGPAAAADKPDWVEMERSLRLELSAKASNGYEMRVRTKGHREVTLSLSRGSIEIEYTTTGRVSRKGIEAEFPGLGSIDVDLRDQRPVVLRPFGLPPFLTAFLPKRKCVGRKAQRFVGRFSGSIEFEGENGFATVDASSGKSRLDRSYRRLCQRVPFWESLRNGGELPGTGRPPLRVTLLSASGKIGGRHVSLRALKFDPGQGMFGLEQAFGTIATGRVAERREGVRIRRSATAFAEFSALQTSPRGKSPTRAKLTLTRPFEGTASLFQERDKPASWTGPLLMRIPAAGGVPLAGPGITARLCRIAGIRELKESSCLKGQAERESLLRDSLLQLSGSHSQALADVRLSISR